MYQMPPYYGMAQVKSQTILAQKPKEKKIKEVSLLQEKEEVDEDSTPDGQEFELEQVESEVNTKMPVDL